MTYPRREKPAELVRLFDVTEAVFVLIQETFAVPVRYELPLHDVDRLDGERDDDRQAAAFALHAMQALRRAATTGIPVTNVEIVRIACTLDASIEHLVHAPSGEPHAPALRQVRDRVNEAARTAAAVGSAVEGGIVEFA